jgi:hypothetical protein
MPKYQPKLKQLAPILNAQKISARSSNLNSLILQANHLQTLSDIFNGVLPAMFKDKFQVNALQGTTLILTCSSASLMTRIQFNKNTIIDHFNHEIKPRRITDFKIKIRPGKHIKIPQKTIRILSKKNAQILKEEAELTEDKKLKAILIRLAEHADQ